MKRYKLALGILVVFLVVIFFLVPAIFFEARESGPYTAPPQHHIRFSIFRGVLAEYSRSYGDYPYHPDGGDEALVQAVHTVYAESPGTIERKLYLLRGPAPDAPQDFVGYVYLNDPKVHLLPDDTIVLAEKPWPGMERRPFAVDMGARLYAVNEQTAGFDEIVGKRGSELVDKNVAARVSP